MAFAMVCNIVYGSAGINIAQIKMGVNEWDIYVQGKSSNRTPCSITTDKSYVAGDLCNLLAKD